MTDKLEEMFEDQNEYMQLLREHRSFPEYPVDLTSKDGQKLVKAISYECADELCEARQLLKNSKSHRVTEVRHFDRDDYIEELTDALHYMIEIAIVSGISVEELHSAYMRKGKINKQRIESGYLSLFRNRIAP